MKRIMKIFPVMALLLVLFPMVGRAQWSFDVGSVEALIDDHKRVRAVLMARSGVEQANELLHEYSKEANVEYDSLNVRLDKYTKCFDVIDVIYNGGVTVLNVWSTYNDVSDKISELSSLIETFMNQCALRGDIVSSDVVIAGACRRAVEQVRVDGKQLVNSLVELSQYATGLRHTTTESLLTVIGNINECLDNIRGCIDHTYFIVWKYVTVRTNYFKRQLYQAKTIGEMCNSAFERWKRGALQVSGVNY